jgi:two-component system, sensor histidine kinase
LALPRTPLIAFSARAFREDVEAWRAADMDAHLAKPADLARLRIALERWVRTADEGSSHA